MLFTTQRTSNLLLLAFATIGLVVIYLVLRSPAYRAKRLGAKLPPGPPRHFLFGNLFSFPRRKWYEAFTLYQQEYGERQIFSVSTTLESGPASKGKESHKRIFLGDLTYANLAGVSVIVVNSLGVAQELNKRLGIYSGRTAKTMTAKL